MRPATLVEIVDFISSYGLAIAAIVLLSVALGCVYISEKVRRGMVLALRSLWLHKLRAFLSVLGIIIGTWAVIHLMAVGEGSMQDALADIERQGATNIIVRSVKPPDDSSSGRRAMIATYGLTYQDYERFQTIGTVVRHVPMRYFPSEIRRLERMFNGRIVGTTPGYLETTKAEVAQGRFFTADDNTSMQNVCVVGSQAAKSLFPYENPIGQTVRLSSHFYRVVGVMADRMPSAGNSASSTGSEEYNGDVYIPLQTCRVRFGDRIFIRTSGSRSGEEVQLSQVILTIKAAQDSKQTGALTDRDRNAVRAAGEVVQNLLERHLRKDWSVTVPLDRLEDAERTKKRYQQQMVAIASISLIVGGIGIMNIMLATVTERTREIGIRRALGAKRRDITLQFLIEAVVQTSLGGFTGMFLALLTVYAIPPLYFMLTEVHMPTQLRVDSIYLAVGVAVSVGVLFGWYPARRASLLDPIEALRHE